MDQTSSKLRTLNAVLALSHANYGRIADNANARGMIEKVIEEVLAVAAAARVELPGLKDPKLALDATMKLATQMAEQFSSTAQDLNLGRPTEIESLNGDDPVRWTVYRLRFLISSPSILHPKRSLPPQAAEAPGGFFLQSAENRPRIKLQAPRSRSTPGPWHPRKSQATTLEHS